MDRNTNNSKTHDSQQINKALDALLESNQNSNEFKIDKFLRIIEPASFATLSSESPLKEANAKTVNLWDSIRLGVKLEKCAKKLSGGNNRSAWKASIAGISKANEELATVRTLRKLQEWTIQLSEEEANDAKDYPKELWKLEAVESNDGGPTVYNIICTDYESKALQWFNARKRDVVKYLGE
eukprot:16090_1